MTDTTTGELILTRSFTVPNEEMLNAAEELQYEYVAKNGIGMSTSMLYFIIAEEDFNEMKPMFIDLKAKYRLSRNWMLSAGVLLAMPFPIFRLDDNENSLTWADYQPDLVSTDDPNMNATVGQATNDIKEGMILHLDLQYTLNFSPKFNLGLNLGILRAPYLTTVYDISSTNGIRVKDYDYSIPGPDNYTVTKDRTPITLKFNSFFGAKVELCPELFFTPRMALNGVVGYMITSETTVREAYGDYADWGFYDESLESNYNGFADDLYFGFDPSKMPGGDPWSLNFSGLYGGLSITLYF